MSRDVLTRPQRVTVAATQVAVMKRRPRAAADQLLTSAAILTDNSRDYLNPTYDKRALHPKPSTCGLGAERQLSRSDH
jgi:hypothetical protein